LCVSRDSTRISVSAGGTRLTCYVTVPSRGSYPVTLTNPDGMYDTLNSLYVWGLHYLLVARSLPQIWTMPLPDDNGPSCRGAHMDREGAATIMFESWPIPLRGAAEKSYAEIHPICGVPRVILRNRPALPRLSTSSWAAPLPWTSSLAVLPLPLSSSCRVGLFGL